MKLTQKQQAYRKMLLKKIHLSKRYINFYKDNKDEWAILLNKHFGVQSSAKLKIDNLVELLDYCNFKRENLPIFKEWHITNAQAKYMRDLWQNYANDKNDEALLSWILKKFKKAYIKIDLIKREDGAMIISVLRGFGK